MWYYIVKAVKPFLNVAFPASVYPFPLRDPKSCIENITFPTLRFCSWMEASNGGKLFLLSFFMIIGELQFAQGRQMCLIILFLFLSIRSFTITRKRGEHFFFLFLVFILSIISFPKWHSESSRRLKKKKQNLSPFVKMVENLPSASLPLNT